MNLRTLVKFNIWDSKKSLAIFYGIMIAVTGLLVMLAILTGEIEFTGMMELSSVIFIFIVGLNAFKSNFHFALANGCSRKSLVLSFIASVFPITMFMAFMDTVINIFSDKLISNRSFFQMIYKQRYASIAATGSVFAQIIDGFLWMTFLYAMFAIIGYFITLVYYRSGRLLKLIVSITPFVLLFGVLPVVNRMTGGSLWRSIARFVIASLGLLNGVNPYKAILTFIFGFIIFGAFSFLLMRKAPIKN